jgi:hypothetical protein
MATCDVEVDMSLPRPHRFLGRAPRGPCSPGASPSSDFVAPPPSLPRCSHCARCARHRCPKAATPTRLPRGTSPLSCASRTRSGDRVRSGRERPRGLPPPRRVAPQRGCRSVAPCSGPGVHRVLRVGLPVPRPKPGPGDVARPTVQCSPRRIPLVSSRAASLRPLPPRRSSTERPPRGVPSGPSPSEVRTPRCEP